MSLWQIEARSSPWTVRKGRGAAPTETPSAVGTAVTHVIDLDPADWYVATWRKLPPLPRPAVEPFDPQECADRVARVTVSGHGWKWDWTRARVSAGLTPEEARFWFEAMTLADANTKPKELAPWLARHDFPIPLTPYEIFIRLKKSCRLLTPEIVLPLRLLLSAETIVEALLSESLGVYDHHPAHQQPSWYLRNAFLAGFRKYVVPYLAVEEAERLREVVALAPPDAFSSPGRTPSPRLVLAAALGMHAHVLEAVSRWPDRDRPGPTDEQVYHVLFGLGEPRLVQHHQRRLALDLWQADHVRAWLAHTELSALDRVRDAILGTAHKDAAEAMMEVFCLVRAPEAAPHVLELKLKSKVPSLARQWLDSQVGNAVAGLVPLVAGRGKPAEAALEYLREAKRRGHAALIEEQLRTAPAAIAARVRAEVLAQAGDGCLPLDAATTPAWLREAAEERPARLPDWVRPTSLPPLVLGGRTLSDRHVLAVLAALRKSTLAEPLPLVCLLRRHLDRARLDAFAWRLFELWQAEGGPIKDRWALAALGLLGGDGCALKLAAHVRAWPAQGQHKRALIGLECLRAIGTDTALMQLGGIAHKVRFKRVQEQARSFIEEIARDRGLSPAQLEDRIVPDLDLDARGGRVFDLGPRRFRFLLGPDFKPLLRDEAGKLRANLPRPNAKDDPARAPAAATAWKLLKRQVREVVKFQARRLELAMIEGRRWTVEEFQRFHVGHPLMINLARLLVWGACDEGNRLRFAFRVTEDGTFADVADAACTLDGVAKVGVVHPLHLDEAQRAAWGEVLGDYEIIPPFPQIGRRVHTLQPGEETACELTRFNGPEIPATLFFGILESHGWTDAHWHEERWYGGFIKRFPGQLVTACLGVHSSSDTMRITRAYFVAGVDAETVCDPRHALPLGHVDPVAVSEVLGSLAVVASKGV